MPGRRGDDEYQERGSAAEPVDSVSDLIKLCDVLPHQQARCHQEASEVAAIAAGAPRWASIPRLEIAPPSDLSGLLARPQDCRRANIRRVGEQVDAFRRGPPDMRA